jgi:drug/metabolite transporter (DMT)-like permease
MRQIMWGDRSGREPSRAKSPLKMRRTLSLAGVALSVAGLVVLGLAGWPLGWAAASLAVLGAIGLADAAVITRRLGQER